MQKQIHDYVCKREIVSKINAAAKKETDPFKAFLDKAKKEIMEYMVKHRIASIPKLKGTNKTWNLQLNKPMKDPSWKKDVEGLITSFEAACKENKTEASYDLFKRFLGLQIESTRSTKRILKLTEDLNAEGQIVSVNQLDKLQMQPISTPTHHLMSDEQKAEINNKHLNPALKNI